MQVRHGVVSGNDAREEALIGGGAAWQRDGAGWRLLIAEIAIQRSATVTFPVQIPPPAIVPRVEKACLLHHANGPHCLHR
jgi:hypothetical protein